VAFADQSVDIDQFRVGHGYSRAEIATVGNVSPPIGSRDPHWAQGIISFSNAVLLLVTFDKANKPDYAYEDRSRCRSSWTLWPYCERRHCSRSISILIMSLLFENLQPLRN